MAYEMSIEVLDGEFPDRLWVEAHGESLVEAVGFRIEDVRYTADGIFAEHIARAV